MDLRALFAPAALFTLTTLAACSPCCANPVVGDETQPLVVQPMVVRDGAYRIPADGDEVQIIVGGQGGLMVVGGVRARNLDACNVSLTARLLSGEGRVVSEYVTTQTLKPNGDGTADLDDDEGARGLRLFPCDDGRDVGIGVPRILEVTATDGTGRSGTAQVTIVPTCGTLGQFCNDRCQAVNQTDGGADAGVDGGP